MWRAIVGQDRLISPTDQVFWALGGTCMGQNARMRPDLPANSHHFGTVAAFLSVGQT